MKQFLLALVLFSSALPAGDAKHPNILFLFSDDQRADTIHALGNSIIQTPNLDKLVENGTTFTRAYCMGAMQGAVCVPSRAMLLTGRTLFRIKDGLESQTTWPEAFATAGYETFITGKWHNGKPALLKSFANGKNIFLGGMTEPYTAVLHDISPDHQISTLHTSSQHVVETFTNTAIEFLKRKHEKPFLLYVPFNTPHDPRLPPPEYRKLYDPAKLSAPPNFLPLHPFQNGDLAGRDEKLAQWPRTEEVVRQHLADYYGCITFLDAQIGKILDALRSSGQYDNTIIVFASDHGLAIGSHGLMGKQNVYDHSMRAPLIFCGPGIPKNRRSDAFCYLLDIFPTLGALASLSGPDGSEGISLKNVISGEKSSARENVFTAYLKHQRAIRTDDWKLIRYPLINKSQLFDLKNDPNEITDLSGRAQYAAKLSEMTALLEKTRANFGDTLPLTAEKPIPAAWTPPKPGETKTK